MRGDDLIQGAMFSYVDLNSRVPTIHPLRPLKQAVDTILAAMSPQFQARYACTGRPSISPERLLRALLLQVLYTIRSERLLVEQLDYNLLFRWFVGLGIDDPIWDHSTFSANRDRLLEQTLLREFFDRKYPEASIYRRRWTVTKLIDSLLSEFSHACSPPARFRCQPARR
ncbi:transposase, partial [Chitinimonas sp. BJB300]|uniref:transposase n=2 Tax=Chitinimonas sp. BJB300 TaxID=1559339 RepID=UPI000C0E4449